MTLSEFDSVCGAEGYETYLIISANQSNSGGGLVPIIYDFEFSEEHVALDGQSLVFSGNGSYLQLIRLYDIKASEEKTCLGDEYIISFLDYNNNKREISVIAR